MRYIILSPDGFTIHPEATYKNKKEAKQAFIKWTEQFTTQGYYSQTCYNGYKRQIPLDQLEDYCDLQTI